MMIIGIVDDDHYDLLCAVNKLDKENVDKESNIKGGTNFKANILDKINHIHTLAY